MNASDENGNVYIAYWFDCEHKILRVAGVYSKKRNAQRRVDKLESGCVQTLTLNRPVRFTHEKVRAK